MGEISSYYAAGYGREGNTERYLELRDKLDQWISVVSQVRNKRHYEIRSLQLDRINQCMQILQTQRILLASPSSWDMTN